MQQPQYKFYATILDAYVWYSQSESESATQELINKINRVPITDENALARMNKGTALNDIIDDFVKGKFKHTNEVTTTHNGFEFDNTLIGNIGYYLQGSIPQHYTSCNIMVENNLVHLYGYIDYILMNKCIDLKTTSKYELGKYKDSMQLHLYPIALYSENIIIDEFEFIVTDFEDVFSETYKIDYSQSLYKLNQTCACLIRFIDANKHLITDKKIFGI